MLSSVVSLVRICAHCQLTNSARHESSSLLQGMEDLSPMDVVFLDLWSPEYSVVDKNSNHKVLMYACCMTYFAAVAFAKEEINAEYVVGLAMEYFFTP